MRHIPSTTACLSLALALVLGACGSAQPASPGNASTAASAPATSEGAQAAPETPPTTTEPTPEPTEAPLAARVNGESITLEAFELEVARYEAGFSIRGVDPATQGDYRATVLEQMIADRLMVQAAVAQGLAVDEAEVQAAYDQSVADAGGEARFQEWLDLNLYTPEGYQEQLRTWLLASKVQSNVIAAVPETAEHVHARHILLATEETAQAIRAQLESGADFATLAVNNSQDQSTRINGGDLGWFPRGILTVPEVEEAAFGQEAGTLSDVVSTFLGFHLVETLEFDPARTISPEARLILQQAAIDNWLIELREQATIERFAP